MTIARRVHALMSGEARGAGATFQRFGLWLASGPYRLAITLRNAAYDRGWRTTRRVSVPVVSVGNLTAGGTGKTPCVEYVARFYRERDLCTAVLSRGYGATEGCNDEALVLEENLPDVPHLQGPDRGELAQTAVEELESEVLILDDGFQHRALHRDLDIVLIDATNPWGYGHLLPRGLLRESERGLARAGMVVLTRCDQVTTSTLADLRQQVARLAPNVPVAEATHRPVELVNGTTTAPLEDLEGRSVLAFCGIGNPEAFRATLNQLGARVMDVREYPDHHPYSRSDVEDLRRWARQAPADVSVITTQKDLVKLRLPELDQRRLWALRIRFTPVTGKQEFDRQLEEAVRSSLAIARSSASS